MANSAISGLPVGSGGWVLIESKTASSSAQLDFSTGIDSTYTNYVFVLENVAPATDGVRLYMRTSADGGSTFDSSTNNYDFSIMGYKVGAIANTNSGILGTTFLAMDSVTIGNGTGEDLSGLVLVSNPADSTYTQVTWWTGGHGTAADDNMVSIGHGQRNSAAAVDAIRFLMSSGNIASGTIKLYGIKDQSGSVTTADASTQAEMEAGTSTSTYVSPGRQQYHESAAKAWVSFTTITTTAINGSYNVTSLTDISAGATTITIATDFSNTNYCPVITGTRDATSSSALVPLTGIRTAASKAVGAIDVIGVNSNFLSGVDYSEMNVVFFGDQ